MDEYTNPQKLLKFMMCRHYPNGYPRLLIIFHLLHVFHKLQLAMCFTLRLGQLSWYLIICVLSYVLSNRFFIFFFMFFFCFLFLQNRPSFPWLEFLFHLQSMKSVFTQSSVFNEEVAGYTRSLQVSSPPLVPCSVWISLPAAIFSPHFTSPRQ